MKHVSLPGGRAGDPARPRAPAGKPVRVALFGLFGRGNLGNDASLEVMLDFLRRERPEAELFCVCKEPSVVARTFAVSAVPLRWTGRIAWLPRRPARLFQRIPARIVDLAHAIGQLRRADVMIVPGTGILDDFGERPGGMPFDILKWCAAARLTRTRIAFVSVGAGPIGDSRSRWMMVTAARLAQFRTWRDEVSRAFMAGAGLDAPPTDLYPDLVFGMETGPVRRRTAGPRLTVGVGIMTYRGWYGFEAGGTEVFEGYIAKMLGFVRHVIGCGHRVRFLTGDSDDWPAVEIALARLSPSERVLVDADPIGSLHDLMDQIADTDIVVATRFHNILCALALAKPAISIGYAEKNQALMTEMGLGDLCHRIDRLDLARLIEQFEQVALLHGRYTDELSRRAEAFRQALAAQERRILEELL